MEPAAIQLARPIGERCDEHLWGRSREGDAEAFAVLFDRHRDRVFRHARRLAGDQREDAEDLVAAAFLEMWRRRRRVRLVDGSVLPWLLATTTNLGLNANRARRRYSRALARLPRTAAVQPDTADVALGFHGLAIDGHLRAALRALKPRDAQLLALVALEDYTVTAAAECLDLSESAARVRLHRARASVKATAIGVKPRVEDPPSRRNDHA